MGLVLGGKLFPRNYDTLLYPACKDCLFIHSTASRQKSDSDGIMTTNLQNLYIGAIELPHTFSLSMKHAT